jgi:hypothetical protein
MNQHSSAKIVFISIAIGSLAVLLLVFSISLDIVLALRFMLGLYGIISLIAILYYLFDQEDVKSKNNYITKTKMYQDRLAVVDEAQKLKLSLNPNPTPEEHNDKVMRDALSDIDDTDRVDN